MSGLVGEIRIFPYTLYPAGWLECDGTSYQIAANKDLYNVIGNNYTKNPDNINFSVPDLRGYAPVGMGQGNGMMAPYKLGQTIGTVEASLDQTQIPVHSHAVNVLIGEDAPPYGTGGFLRDPTGANLGELLSNITFQAQAAFTATNSQNEQMGNGTIAPAGTAFSPTHENRQPFLALRFCICATGTD